MALIDKKTDEYLKIKEVNTYTGKVEIEIFKNKDTRRSFTEWDKIKNKNISISIEKFNESADNTKSVKDNILSKTYNTIKESHFLEDDYYNDL